MNNKGYRRIYPDQESIIFDGGLDNKFPKALLPDNESPDCANVVFYNGAVETRDGAVKLNTAAAGTNPFDGLYTRRDNSGAETMCAFINGHMKTLGTTTFITVPSAQSVFTIGSRVAADTAENYLFIGNGGAGPYKWDGTNFTQHGVPAPTQTMTVASNGAGSLTSGLQVMYKYTYINSAAVEGDVSPAVTFVVNSSGGQNTLSNIGVAPISAGVAKRRIYRTVGSGVAFLKLTDISDNTTTTFNDNVPDGSLGVAAPTDNGVPPKYSAILYHRNILFVNDPANPNYVWYSNVGNPYTFPSTNFFKVGDKTSDLVKGFAAYDNHLVVFCENSTWINYMPDPATPSGWRQLRTNSSYGSKSPFSFVSYNNKILFPATQNKKFVGFAALSGLSADPTSTLLTVTSAGSELQSDRIEPDMFNVQESSLTNISSIVYKTRAYISLTYGSGATANNRIYCFDFSTNNIKKSQKVSWVPFTGLSAQQFTIYSGKLYFASSSSNGFVYQMDGTGVYSDDGVAINSYYWTKEFPGFGEDTNFHKDFRYTNILLDNSGAYFMNIGYRADSDSGSGQSQQISVNPGGSLWGTMVWGRDTWGGGSSQAEVRVYVSPARGKRIQFMFSNQNTAGQKFKVYRMNFLYNIRGYR
jgi:hypothetical protein